MSVCFHIVVSQYKYIIICSFTVSSYSVAWNIFHCYIKDPLTLCVIQPCICVLVYFVYKYIYIYKNIYLFICVIDFVSYWTKKNVTTYVFFFISSAHFHAFDSKLVNNRCSGQVHMRTNQAANWQFCKSTIWPQISIKI